MNIAVITGASSGFGGEFVRRLDGRGFDEIWVIARRKERLEALQSEVKTKLRPLALDLSKPESIAEYRAELEKEKPNVSVLVNAAGFGYFNPFTKESLELSLNMIDINDKALVSLCYDTLPFMQRGGEIYNIASTSSFQPVPYIGIYAATKSFVLSFSRSLNVELRERGIKVMAVCPHWTKTEFFDTAVHDDSVIQYYNFYNIQSDVVSTAIRNMQKGRDVSLCGWRIKLQVLAVKLLPHKFVMRTWCKQQNKPL